MLKNKFKLLLIILMVIAIALSPLSFADDETTADEATNDAVVEENVQEEASEQEENVQEETNEQEENTQEDSGEEIENVQDISAVQETQKSGDQYLIGDVITVDYIVDGNLFVLANEVTIKSQIIGNAFVMANKVTLTDEGYIGASFYALGNDVEISGVTFDAYVTAENLTIPGYVYRDLHSISKNFNIYGAIGRDASVGAENFSFKKYEVEDEDSLGQIMGNFDYSANNEIEIPEGVVAGEVKYSPLTKGNYTPNYVFLAISSIILVLIVWGLLKWLAPKFEEKVDNLVTDKPLKTAGFGLLALIIVPIIAVLLMITGIAASAGLLVLAAYLILICVNRAISIIAINNIIAKKAKFETTVKKLLLLIGTSLVIWAIALIPYVWVLVNLVLEICGFGIIVRSIFKK